MEKQKEKVKTAVAIAYEPGEEAPKILATGKGLVAERIIEKAKEEVENTIKEEGERCFKCVKFLRNLSSKKKHGPI